MKFRPHRGSLADAMAECVDLSGKQDFFDHLRKIHPDYGPAFNPDEVKVEHYADGDPRIHWPDVYIVTQEHWGVIGFMDEDPMAAPKPLPRNCPDCTLAQFYSSADDKCYHCGRNVG